MKITTVWALSLILGLAACSEQKREEMRHETRETGQGIDRGVDRGFNDTGDRLLEGERHENQYDRGTPVERAP